VARYQIGVGIDGRVECRSASVSWESLVTLQVETFRDRSTQPASRLVLGSAAFTITAFLLDVLAIFGLGLITGIAYHIYAYGAVGDLSNYAEVGGVAALCYTLPFLFRDEYRIQDYLEGRRHPGRTFVVWNYAFLSLAVIGFLTKTTGIFSRGWLAAFYIAGLCTLTALSAGVGVMLRSLLDAGRLATRRIMLVGSQDEICRITTLMSGDRSGVRIVAHQVLPAAHERSLGTVLNPALAEATATARALHVNDVIVLADWSRDDLVDQIVKAFMVLPVTVHLGASGLLGRFSDARVARLGGLTALSLTAPPLGPLQALIKRTFDMVIAAVALVLLSPLMVIIALLIKFDSRGPVFFLQRRRGYNLNEFRIWKFRTMTTLEDGDVVVQAQANDSRVTRVGHYLRRLNFDELPQLINVLRGEMSLVGPRPHAVAHDKQFEQTILSYPRRLNMRPGITGWAQVNGFRGRTETDDAMRERVEYDLYYIDNWTVLFDVYILFMTVFSPKAFRNAG
jgi:Undecaprenyl-phosphate glucose phosphotransferase